ncbi:hypothetical protein HYC85_014495 [Camellia sinensis]|uniref:Dirigent protein n=1 Tax=Camellia sinensis TaxID=4442 RepID=A0A7J7H9R8_CAMSI|nr:hypothetical protein HYC85_014495 [Camellia sinensis]
MTKFPWSRVEICNKHPQNLLTRTMIDRHSLGPLQLQTTVRSYLSLPNGTKINYNAHQIGLPLRSSHRCILTIQHYCAGPNATEATLTKVLAFDSFGTTYVFDNQITQSLDKNSTEIAGGQGIYVTSSLEGANTQLLCSIVFTSNEYNGSTLEIQGRIIQLAYGRETFMVGGTGKFKLAKAIATFETIYVDTSIFLRAHMVQSDSNAKYLGPPSFWGRSKAEAFEFIIEKFVPGGTGRTDPRSSNLCPNDQAH